MIRECAEDLIYIMRVMLLLGTAVLPMASPAAAEPVAGPVFRNVLMPQPASLVRRPGDLELTPALTVRVDSLKSERLDRAVARTMRQLREKTGLPFGAESGKGNSGKQIILRVQT